MAHTHHTTSKQFDHFRITARRNEKKPTAEQRKVILSQGDSWFAYPLHGHTPSNLVQALYQRRDFIWHSLEDNGREMLTMASAPGSHQLLKIISQYDIDVLLLSGGGNDIVGPNDFIMFLNRKRPGMTWQACINQEVFGHRLKGIEMAYRWFIHAADAFAKNRRMVLLTHTYDYLKPSGIGIRKVLGLLKKGPWIKPYLEEMDITDKDDQERIVCNLLEQFRDMLLALEAEYAPYLRVANLLGTLPPDMAWHNEIHPKRQGFKDLGDKLWIEVKDLLDHPPPLRGAAAAAVGPVV